jgi:hypothetical protein
MANRNTTPTALSAVGTTATMPAMDAAPIGGIVGGMLALVLVLALVGILIFCRLLRSRTATTPSSAPSEYGVLPAQDRTYSAVADVRIPRNDYEYEATVD